MKTISEHLDNISFNNMVNEDFVEPHLREFVKQLHKSKEKFNTYFSHWALRWDRLDSSVIKEYPATDDIDKIIRKSKPCFVFGIKNGKYVLFIDPSFDLYELDGRTGGFKRAYDAKQYYIFDQCKDCDSIVIIDYNKAKEDVGASDLQRERNAAQTGMWMRNPGDFPRGGDYEDWCKGLAEANIKRYKQIIAKNHAEKDDEFNKISDRINSLLQRALQISTDLSKGKESLEGKAYEVGSLLQKFYGISYWDSGSHKSLGSNGILKLVSEYLKDKQELRSGKSYSPEDTEKRAKLILDKITQMCDSVEAKIEELEK